MTICFRILLHLLVFLSLFNESACTYIANFSVRNGQVPMQSLTSPSDQTSLNDITFTTPFPTGTSPQILLGLAKLSLSTNNIQIINFALSASAITESGFKATLSKTNTLSSVYDVELSYIAAIYLKLFIASEDLNFQSYVTTRTSTSIIAKKSLAYTLPFNAGTQTRKVTAYITGFSHTFANPANPQNKISIFLDITQSTNTFELTITCNDINHAVNLLTRVSYNYTEFIQEVSVTSPYTKVSQNIDMTYALITPANQMGVAASQVKQDGANINPFVFGTHSTIFAGLISIQTSTNTNELHFGVQKISMNTSGGVSDLLVQYSTWDSTVLESLIVGYLQFATLNCSTETTTVRFSDFKQSCYATCPSKTYSATTAGRSICAGCHSSCLTCLGPTYQDCQTCDGSLYLLHSSCFETIPDGTFCLQQSMRICSDCTVTSCKRCNSGLNICYSCMNNLYLADNLCVATIPVGKYCNASRICYTCPTLCETCTSNTECQSCKLGYFFFQNYCFITQPDITYCDSNKICNSCPSGCSTCSSGTMCSSCFPLLKFYANSCYPSTPAHTYCDASLTCYDCNAACSSCDILSTFCTACYASAMYLYNNACLVTQPQNTGCSAFGDYKQCKQCPNYCLTCNDMLQCTSCSTSSSTPYYFENGCYSTPPIGTFCDKNTSTCQKCEKPCATCTNGTTFDNCLTCTEGFVLIEQSKCVCEDKMKTYNQSNRTCDWKGVAGMSSETAESIKTSLESLSVSTSALSLLFAVSSGFTKSGTSMLSQAFTLQKIFYQQVTNIRPPHFLTEFLKSIDGNGILKKYKLFNAFELFLSTSDSEMDYEYGSMEIKRGILHNAGGAFVIEIVLAIVQMIFIIGLRGVTQKNMDTSRMLQAYQMFVCGTMLQMLPLIMFVIVDSICLEVTIFGELGTFYEVGVLILQVVLCVVNIVMILVFLGSVQLNQESEAAKEQELQFLWQPQQNSQQQSYQLQQVNQQIKAQQSVVLCVVEEQLRRDTIQEKYAQRSYLLFYYVCEAILCPVISVFSRSSFFLSMGLLTIVQFAEFVYTIKVRPFYLQIVNVSFVAEQGLVLASYVSYFVMAVLIKTMDHKASVELPNGILVFAFLSTGFSMLAIVMNPIAQIVLIASGVRQILEQRARKNFKGNFTNQQVSLFATVELARKQNIEFPLSLQTQSFQFSTIMKSS